MLTKIEFLIIKEVSSANIDIYIIDQLVEAAFPVLFREKSLFLVIECL
jgi:hypothetical protein